MKNKFLKTLFVAICLMVVMFSSCSKNKGKTNINWKLNVKDGERGFVNFNENASPPLRKLFGKSVPIPIMSAVIFDYGKYGISKKEHKEDFYNYKRNGHSGANSFTITIAEAKRIVEDNNLSAAHGSISRFYKEKTGVSVAVELEVHNTKGNIRITGSDKDGVIEVKLFPKGEGILLSQTEVLP